MSDTSTTLATLMRHEKPKCSTSETRSTRVRDECYTNDTSVTWVLHKRHECDTSEKLLILITARIKTYFHIHIFTIWQEKDYKERNNFILSTTFRNASFPCQNEKLEFLMVRAISKSYTLDCSCKFPCAFPHSYA